MEKFVFLKNDENFILHQLPPKILIQIILNDSVEYDVFEDVYEMFEFRGNKILVKWYADEDEISEIEDFRLIRSILRRAWGFYKSKVFIDKREFIAGVMEDERFKIENQKDSEHWLVTDKDNLIVIFFENHRFNDTQRIVPIYEITQEQIKILPRILREMSEWLAQNHYDKVF